MPQNFLKNFLWALILSTSFIYSPISAAAPPDAGQIIQEIPKEEKLPIETTPLEIEDNLKMLSYKIDDSLWEKLRNDNLIP